MRDRVIGILGGMGPEATIYMFTKIVKETKVKTDQDHFRILIYNNPKIPDRTLAIEGKGPSPLPDLIKSAKLLEKGGADFILIPCVTAHFYYDSLKEKLKIPILHIIGETAKFIKKKYKGVKKIGLLATTGAIKTGLFQNFFSSEGVELVLPSSVVQERLVMKAIYGKRGIKAIGPSEVSRNLILKACEFLIRKGAQLIIAGCTEIPLVLKDGDVSVPVVDPIHILAQAAIRKARSSKR